MPRRLDDTKRAAILTDIKTGAKPRNQIARDHGVSPSTVTGIARDAGLDTAFDRSAVESATRAKVADNAARRAQIVSDLLDDVQRFRKRAWSAYPVVASGPDGPEVINLPKPPLRDAQAAYTSIGICMDKSMAVEKHDKPGEDSTSGMLVDLAEKLGAAWRSQH